jgi:hypothetical protein
MVYGYGRGFGGRRGGAGFGFRGSSPPWPYVGRGRGGLPRCAYPGLTGAAVPYGQGPFEPVPTGGEELNILRSQAEATKRQLEDIERRIKELENKNVSSKE